MDFLSYLSYLILILLISIIAIKCTSHSRARPKFNLPPGPKPLPIIGNLLEIGDKPHKSMAKLSETYGSIMTLQLGQLTTIVVSSSAAAKEILQTHDQFLLNRTIPDAINALEHGKFGLAWMPVSPTWRKLRKICNVHLFAPRVLDDNMELRHKKVRELLAEVRKSAECGEAVNFGKSAFKTSLNLLSSTFFSLEHLADDSSSNTIREFKETVWSIMEEVGKPNIADYFPFFRKIDPQRIKKRTTVYFRRLTDLFDDFIDRRFRQRENSTASQNNDVLDTLVNFMMLDDHDDDHIDKTTIQHLLLDLFAAGTETTSSTLEWSMSEILKAPHTMSKAKDELNRVIGKGNQLYESHIPNLPYLQAIVKEALRLHPPIPFLIPRRAETDVHLDGLVIPRGSQVIVNAWAVSRDPGVWDNPNEFVPERFLGSDFEFRGRDTGLVPFGGGRRICPGLPLAMRMLHLMLGSLVHSFDWELENGVLPESLDMDDKFGITLQRAKPLKALATSVA